MKVYFISSVWSLLFWFLHFSFRYVWSIFGCNSSCSSGTAFRVNQLVLPSLFYSDWSIFGFVTWDFETIFRVNQLSAKQIMSDPVWFQRYSYKDINLINWFQVRDASSLRAIKFCVELFVYIVLLFPVRYGVTDRFKFLAGNADRRYAANEG